MSKPLPFGAITFATSANAPTTGHELCALAVDLHRCQLVEPRLKIARWLDDPPPMPGSRAEIAAQIRFSTPIVRRVVGQLQGIATLDEFEPPHRLAYGLATARGVGRIDVLFSEAASGCLVQVDGWILPRSAIAMMALMPLTGMLERLAGQAVNRGILRAAVATVAASGEELGAS
jgi:hypothetical protein